MGVVDPKVILASLKYIDSVCLAARHLPRKCQSAGGPTAGSEKPALKYGVLVCGTAWGPPMYKKEKPALQGEKLRAYLLRGAFTAPPEAQLAAGIKKTNPTRPSRSPESRGSPRLAGPARRLFFFFFLSLLRNKAAAITTQADGCPVYKRVIIQKSGAGFCLICTEYTDTRIILW